MQINNLERISITGLVEAQTNTVQKLNAAMQQLREKERETRLFKKTEIDYSHGSMLAIRWQAIQELTKHLNTDMLTEYLKGLGYVREQLIAARDVLNANGKKKYEAHIKNAVEKLPAQFCGLKPYYLNILTDLMDIPFKRSAEKDRREISDSLCQIACFISEYRYEGTDERYRGYAETIIRGIDTDPIPPMIAGLIIQEVISLLDSAYTANVFAYVASGITHEELWRYSYPEEYAEEYPSGEIPADAEPLEAMDCYPPYEGIAKQSLWWGIDDCVDDFVASFVGGLWYAKHPLQACITDFAHQKI